MENKAKMQDRLKEAMELRGVRSVDLVERTGVPKGAISYYLAGKSQPKAERLHIIAKALDVSEAWLLGSDVPMARTLEQKKNDQLAQLIVRLRREPELLETMLNLAELPAEQFAAVKQMLVAFSQQ